MCVIVMCDEEMLVMLLSVLLFELLSLMVLFVIEGMWCGGCSAAVRNVFDARDDVEAAVVNLVMEMVVVWFKMMLMIVGSLDVLIESVVVEIGKKGFKMTWREFGRAAEAAAREASARREEEMEWMKWDLYKVWGLMVVCLGMYLIYYLYVFGLYEYVYMEVLNVLA